MIANSISVGNILKYRDSFWLVTKTEHVKPGKGGAFMQVEMKDILKGTKLNERFRASEDVEKAYLEEIEYQYQYDEGETVALMNNQNFDQVSISKNIFGNQIVYLQDGMNIKIEYCEEIPVSVKMPENIVLEVVETDSYIKGQTVTSSFKPAKLENGAKIMVPPFITNGTKILVKIEDGSYIERAK